MIKTQSSEMFHDNINISIKSNRVPYMGCQSLMYHNKINKETVLRLNKTMNISLEEISNVPTSVLIHQSSPQSIPSFSTYHSDETLYNERLEDNVGNAFDIYDRQPLERSTTEIKKEKSDSVRAKHKLLQCQSFTSSHVNKKFLPICVTGRKSPSSHEHDPPSKENDSFDLVSVRKFEAFQSSPSLRPISYYSTNCWDEFISSFVSNGSKNIFWTRQSLKQPILNYVQKGQGKNAIKSFKVIQKYMGDRRTRKSPSQLIALLQSYVSFHEALKDEVLIQICKQTIKNPDCRSSCRGWELLSECLLQFSPGQRLLPYLDDFINTSLVREESLDPSSLNTSLAYIRKCEYHLSWSLKSRVIETKDSSLNDSSLVTVLNQKRKRSFSETKENGIRHVVIYSPQNLSSLMKQQLLSFPLEEVPLELVTICKQIALDIEDSESFISMYRTFSDPKSVMKVSRDLEKWFNNSCQKGAHLFDMKNVPNMQMMSIHVLVYWFESLSQPVISQQMAFLSNFSIKNLTKINKKVLLYMVNFFKVHVINKSKDNIRNIASFLCSLIFQLSKEKYYPLDSPKDSVYMNIILPIFRNYC